MLQTLYARAKESKKPDHVIYDAKAIEIVEELDYDFTKADKDTAMASGVIARTNRYSIRWWENFWKKIRTQSL